jgi:hypothetical protein
VLRNAIAVIACHAVSTRDSTLIATSPDRHCKTRILSRACESAAVSLARWPFSLGLTIYSAIMWRRSQHIIGRVEPGQPGHDLASVN